MFNRTGQNSKHTPALPPAVPRLPHPHPHPAFAHRHTTQADVPASKHIATNANCPRRPPSCPTPALFLAHSTHQHPTKVTRPSPLALQCASN